ncbi:MAG: DUF1016 family protein [Bacilli bacterium]|nr:DUF1016 family protein [Bacilli bacterium]
MNKAKNLKDDYYNEIKNQLLNNEITNKVKDYSKNKSDLETYYNVGQMLANAGKRYGEGIIKNYSIKLMNEIDKKYNERTLRRYRQFYLLFSTHQKWSTLSTRLSWSHYSELLILKDISAINYYINLVNKQNLSVRQLRDRIKLKEYERLDDDTKLKLINKEDTTITDLVPNPIIIKNTNSLATIKEKALQKLIVDNIEDFLEQLGAGYTFIKSEYKIKLGNTFNYIDLLLFNIEYDCYVVIELKVSELKKEHLGQIQVYMNYIDTKVKKINHNKTIGIILVRKDNKYIVKYSSDERIISREYELI